MIDLNITLLIQLINFLVTLIVLNYLLIKPIRNVILQRKNVENEISGNISVLIDKGSEKLAQYEHSLRQTRNEAANLRKEVQQQALLVQTDILNTASNNALSHVQDNRQRHSNETNAARTALNSQVSKLTDAMTKKLLG